MTIESLNHLRVITCEFHKNFIRKHPHSPISGTVDDTEFKNPKTTKIRRDHVKEFSRDREVMKEHLQVVINHYKKVIDKPTADQPKKSKSHRDEEKKKPSSEDSDVE